ncbi:reverse transcriptase domain-containing protein [Tanacetum coccineum]
MSTNEQTPLSQPTSIVRNTLVKEQVPQDLGKPISDEALREYCDKNYHQILPIIAERVHQEKVQQEKLKAVKARLNFEETSRHSESGTLSRRRDLKERLGPRHARSMSGSPEPRRGRSKSPRKEVRKEKQCIGHTTVAAETLKAATRVLASEKQNLLFRNIITKEHPREEWKCCQKVKKVARQKITQTFSLESIISFPPIGEEDGTEGPKIIEVEMGGHCVHRMYVDGGFSSEILYEHYFNRFLSEVRNQMIPATTSLVGFSGEIIWPLGQTSLLVKIGDEEHSTSTWMNFMVMRSPSSYNGIIGRPGVRRIRAVPSIAHGMLKSPVTGGTVILRSSMIILLECTMVSGPGVSQPVINQATEEKIQVAIHPEYPEQTVAICSTLIEEGRKELCGLLRRNLDIFAWKPADMTRVSRHIAEHRLNIREGCLPVRQKKRGQAPERNKAIYKEVEKLVDADFKDLNKTYPKDGYPLSKIDWKVESLCGNLFKCFLDAYKGYHQIQMAKEQEEKTAFITSQEIFCYSKIPFGLKNARATYQRLVDKAFQKQIGRNLELNPKKCAFGMREGTFLGYKVEADGLRVCPNKVEAVLNLPSPKCLKDVQKLNGNLASLNRFLSKSAEKSLPLFKTLKKCTKKSDFQWTAEAEMAFKQMKKLIAELPMLTAPKEKEELIMYLAAAKEAISAVLMTERDGNKCLSTSLAMHYRVRKSTTLQWKN